MLFYQNLDEFVSGQREKLDSLFEAKIPERGIILKTLLADNSLDRKSDVANYSLTKEVEQIEADYLGIVGDRHRGAFRQSTSRETLLYPKGTIIREHRHVLAVSSFDCEVLSEKLGVEVTPELLGANLVIGREDGVDYSLSALPENTHLVITKEDFKLVTTLKHYVMQQGCGVTGNMIANKYGDKNLIKKFIEASKNNRGIVCSVEYPVKESAVIKRGMSVYFGFPKGISK